ncbi:glycolipid transfer protein isoform X2 [Vespula squamosa]|uniref:Glycolipid transfer protein isoform X2 n=1 Tax=Vespula squamosa TaxID=30214 RepID=A0ABD2BTC6_VESSQ
MALPSEETVPNVLINTIYFPDIVDGKIPTENFLHASRGVVVIIEKFGKLFAPVKHDMDGNIEKLNNKYSLDKEKHKTLQDMILLEIEEGKTVIATESLIWLRRSLYMILLFFEKIIEDHNAGKATDDLVAFLKEAYKISLEPYHGWMIQQLFDEKDLPDAVILRDMEIYSKNLRLNIENLQIFYEIHELEKYL